MIMPTNRHSPGADDKFCSGCDSALDCFHGVFETVLNMAGKCQHPPAFPNSRGQHDSIGISDLVWLDSRLIMADKFRTGYQESDLRFFVDRHHVYSD